MNADSPEAFEEMLWKAFWGSNYQGDRISPWPSDVSGEFPEFFHAHMRKIIALRSRPGEPTPRYVSKNNNIARLDVLHSLFPDATIIVPFRDPIQHAASLLLQHENFLRIHEQDAFARDYMKAIGHYDFGQNLKPIDFGRWLDSAESPDPHLLSSWVQYWIAAYRHICAAATDHVFLLSYERLCATPQDGLARLADVLDLQHRDALLSQAHSLRTPKPRAVDTQRMSNVVRDEAQAVFEQLKGISSV